SILIRPLPSTAPAPPDIYTLSLHDALPIWEPRGRACGDAPRLSTSNPPSCGRGRRERSVRTMDPGARPNAGRLVGQIDNLGLLVDRKSTRLNSSHEWISYAVFCLKKKKHQR